MIRLKNISKTYRMGDVDIPALNNVSLTIDHGEFVAIMGPSGSGKSTLMHVLGLLDRPDHGSYTIHGTELTTVSDTQRAIIRNRFVGFIFQQFHLLPRMTARENVELPLVYAGKGHLPEKARHEIETVGLLSRINHRPNELSGGQQQRVAIARALVNDPLIILADEPTGNLDSKSKEEIIGILKRLNESGKTVVIVTHENEIAAHAKRILLFRDGVIISDTTHAPNTPPRQAENDASSSTLVSDLTRHTGGVTILDYFREAALAMIAHKMRSLLSILGVLIGVAAVIAMLAIGEGAKVSIEKQLASLGSNLLVIRPGSHRMHGVAIESGSVTRFTFQDVDFIRKMDEGVRRVSPSVTGRGQLVAGNKNWNSQLEGVDVDYAEMRASVPIAGRFFTTAEVTAREKVAIIGTTVARELFGEKNPVGETFKINLNNFRIIGVLPSKGANAFNDQDDVVLIPVTTAMFRILGKEYIDTIFVEATDAATIDTTIDAITALIKKKHRLKADDEDSFEIRNMSDIKNALTATTTTMSLLIGAIAAISLLVGGIGIMNIMLVSVTERTREIGLRKALGANEHDIMVQFLIEAILLSLFGGIGGIALGMSASLLITSLAGWAVRISPLSIILATGFSLIIGVLFGLWPAKQAARLNPIEALRYE